MSLNQEIKNKIKINTFIFLFFYFLLYLHTPHDSMTLSIGGDGQGVSKV